MKMKKLRDDKAGFIMKLKIIQLLCVVGLFSLLFSSCVSHKGSSTPAIHISNYNGTIYKYDWGTLKLSSQAFVGPGIVRVASDDEGRHLYAISPDKHTLAAINAQTYAIEKNVILDEKPGDIAYLYGSAKLYIALPALKAITILSVPSFKLAGTIKLNSFPDRLVSSPDGSRLYVVVGAEEDSPPESLIAIDAKTGTLVGEVKLLKDWHELAITKLGDYMYVSNRRSGSVTVVNLNNFRVENTFENITKRSFPDGTVGGMVISPNSDYLYFCDDQSNYIRVIDLRNGEIAKEIMVDPRITSLYISRRGDYLISIFTGYLGIDVPYKGPGSVSIIDIASWKVTKKFEIENGGFNIILSPSL